MTAISDITKRFYGCKCKTLAFSKKLSILFFLIAIAGMLGLGMEPNEGFFTYSSQFIFLIMILVPGNMVMVAIDICGKSSTTGEGIYGITWKHVLAFMFFVYYLFVCLITFLHFFICNVWFVLADNRILVFI